MTKERVIVSQKAAALETFGASTLAAFEAGNKALRQAAADRRTPSLSRAEFLNFRAIWHVYLYYIPTGPRRLQVLYQPQLYP